MTRENHRPSLGPCTIATLASSRAAALVDDYCSYLHCHVLESDALTAALAEQWDCSSLAGTRYWLLGNSAGRAWLRIVEDPAAEAAMPAQHPGWMALEILVEDVDALAATLAGSPFEILRPAANLELSDNIRAAQILGPAGELLYLTQVKDEVPPFQLPRASCTVDHLFIPILACSDRDAALRNYETLAGNKGLSFETRVTVLNQLRGYPMEQRHPLATLQLADATLIEIDQLQDLQATETEADSLGGGIAMITFAIDHLPEQLAYLCHETAPYNGRRSCLLRGSAGERIELIERDAGNRQ